jgi:hypothetical protein
VIISKVNAYSCWTESCASKTSIKLQVGFYLCEEFGVGGCRIHCVERIVGHSKSLEVKTSKRLQMGFHLEEFGVGGCRKHCVEVMVGHSKGLEVEGF